MKIILLVQALIIISTTLCCGQISVSNEKKSVEKITKACKRPIENKDIVLCSIKADTLTFEQLKNCNELTINNNKNQKITSYLLSFYLPDGTTVREFKSASNKLSKETVTEIINSDVKKILLEEIIGTEGKEYISLGQRWFYFK